MNEHQKDLAARYKRGEIDIRFRVRRNDGKWSGWFSLRRAQVYGPLPFPWDIVATEVEYREGPAPAGRRVAQ